jgi:hypothetical protein
MVKFQWMSQQKTAFKNRRTGEDDMKIKQNIILTFLIIAAIFLIVGCANRSKELLAEDFKKMGNEDLLRYFYRLNDEIESQEKQSGPQVGIGMGSFGGGVGGGVGVTTGGTGYTAEDLRARRIDVRLELKRRGLNP